MLTAGCDGLTSILFPRHMWIQLIPAVFFGWRGRKIIKHETFDFQRGWLKPSKKQNGTSKFIVKFQAQFEKKRSLHPNIACFFPHKKKSKWIDTSTASQKIHLRCQRHPYLSRSLRGADLPTVGCSNGGVSGAVFPYQSSNLARCFTTPHEIKGIQWRQFTIGNESQHFPVPRFKCTFFSVFITTRDNL